MKNAHIKGIRTASHSILEQSITHKKQKSEGATFKLVRGKQFNQKQLKYIKVQNVLKLKVKKHCEDSSILKLCTNYQVKKRNGVIQEMHLYFLWKKAITKDEG